MKNTISMLQSALHDTSLLVTMLLQFVPASQQLLFASYVNTSYVREPETA